LKITRGQEKESLEIEDSQITKFPEKGIRSQNSKWKTSKAIRKAALEKAERKCEFNPEHETFVDAQEMNFMEGHHLIPMEYQDLFEVSLDFIGNIVSLCPNCHREIHHANPRRRKSMALSLFNKKKKVINDLIEIDEFRLMSFYDESL
jgi:5-methylcytosine-specific restriction protein A